MPVLGIGLHILVALFFAIHAVRSGQQLFWLFILFSFPMLGSIVYFVVIYLPETRLQQGARKVATLAAATLDPTRELREARAAFDYTPTAQNQMRLARALLESGAAEEAAANYEACLKGPLHSDPEIKLCAARALVESRQFDRAIGHLQAVRAADAGFRPEALALLLARALAGAGRMPEARAEFEAAVAQFGSFDSRAEYAIFALQTGDTATAARLQGELQQAMKQWTRRTRALHAATLRRLDEAQARSGRG